MAREVEGTIEDLSKPTTAVCNCGHFYFKLTLRKVNSLTVIDQAECGLCHKMYFAEKAE